MDNLLLSENFWQLGILFLRNITEKQLNSDSDLTLLVLELPSDDLGHNFYPPAGLHVLEAADIHGSVFCVLGCTCTHPSAMLKVT